MTVSAGTLTKLRIPSRDFSHRNRCVFLAVEPFSNNKQDIINSISRLLLALHIFLGNISESLWF